jgi:glycosyltransferase involved in cell wall biosynthesis
MTVPLVSIALPVFNGEKWLDQAIRTLVKQSYENMEIIIADDCSSDNSPKICEQYASSYSQITFIKNETNLGGQGNFLKILNLCSGKYITYASQDDYWDENFISYLVEKLESNNRAVLAGCATQLLDEKDQKYNEIRYNGKWNPEKLSTYRLIYSLMLPLNYWKWIKNKKLIKNTNYEKWIKNNFFFHGVIRTKSLKYCFCIFPGVVGHDRHFLLLLALSGKWCYVDRVLYFRRVGAGGMLLKEMSNDPIYRLKNNIFHPIISLFQMFIGVIKHRDSKILAKLFSIPIIVAHVIYEISKPFQAMAIKIIKYCYKRILLFP